VADERKGGRDVEDHVKDGNSAEEELKILHIEDHAKTRILVTFV
jgi:hypothetical protein